MNYQPLEGAPPATRTKHGLKSLRGVQPGAILGRLRDLLAKREGAHRELTKAAKRDWRNLIEYNRQDVLGMIHLVEYVRREGTA